jgi:hypothetical protein
MPLLVDEIGTPMKLGGGDCHTNVCCCRRIGPQLFIVIGDGVCAPEENAIVTIVDAQKATAAKVRIFANSKDAEGLPARSLTMLLKGSVFE